MLLLYLNMFCLQFCFVFSKKHNIKMCRSLYIHFRFFNIASKCFKMFSVASPFLFNDSSIGNAWTPQNLCQTEWSCSPADDPRSILFLKSVRLYKESYHQYHKFYSINNLEIIQNCKSLSLQFSKSLVFYFQI